MLSVLILGASGGIGGALIAHHRRQGHHQGLHVASLSRRDDGFDITDEACVLALHPGTVETQFSAKYAGRHPTVSAAQAAAHLASVMENAQPELTGHFYDYTGRAIVW